MATFTLTKRGAVANSPTNPNPYPHSPMVNLNGAKVVSAIFDGPAATLIKGSAIASTDVFELVPVPKGAFVVAVHYKVTTVEGGTCTFSIGDGASATQFLATASGNALTDAAGATTTAKLYTADDTIDVAFPTGTAANVIIKVAVMYFETDPLVA